jgi:hypothetical protein
MSIGYVKIHKAPEQGFDYEVPLLYSIGIKRNDDRGYIATCIHLQIDGYGDTLQEASNDMAHNARSYLFENFRCAENKDDAWENLNELFKSNQEMGIWWEKFREMQISLAKMGIPADPYSEVYQKVRSLECKAQKSEVEFSKKIQELQELQVEIAEKVHRLESELSNKDDLISWWIDSEFDMTMIEEPCRGVK